MAKVAGDGLLGRIRRQLIDLARRRHREDLAALFDRPVSERSKQARAVAHAIEQSVKSGACAHEPGIGG